jgi:hypothetical protein
MENKLDKEDTRILVAIPMDKDDLWSEVFGSGWEHQPWWVECQYLVGDWATNGKVVMHYCDPEDDSVPVQKSDIITIESIADAYSFLLLDDFTHCFGEPLSESDACTSDAILQIAVFGELLYS